LHIDRTALVIGQCAGFRNERIVSGSCAYFIDVCLAARVDLR